MKLRYDESLVFKGQVRPFVIDEIRPIQVSGLGVDKLREARAAFTRDEWIDFLMRSLGLEPTHEYFTLRRKMLYLARLIPLIEKNFNLIELGPRGTGKSFVYQQVSPYCHLVSGGQTTVAQMFVNLASGQRGLVCLWDTVAFDEAAGIRFPDKNGINIMKGYMEDGNFSRGSDMITAEGSIVFVGNIDGDIETILRTSNLFYPMPKEMDAAFYDRLHFYLPGWELGKTRDEYYTDHFGLVSDYLAEVVRVLRKESYTDVPERYFKFGPHLSGRDQKATRKTVSGLIKLLHPDGQVTKEEVEEYMRFGMEMRRRVKEQLRKIAGVEYWDVNFSYRDLETGKEQLVPVPEMGGGQIIEPGPDGARLDLHDRQGRRDRQAGALPARGADDERVRPHHPARQPVADDEGSDQDRRRLPQGAREGPRHHQGHQVLRLQHPGGQPEPGQGGRRDSGGLLHRARLGADREAAARAARRARRDERPGHAA